MDATPIVLASASPRRRRLIGWLGLPVTTTAVDIDEDLSLPLDPASLACALAEAKAAEARLAGAQGAVLAFDTIVVLDGGVLGKPTDLPDAWRMLRALSARDHSVITGVTLLAEGAASGRAFPVETRVTMRPLAEGDIAAWAAEGELLGCAGAYNIERHLASVALDECFHNVAGMPLCHVYRAIAAGALGSVPVGLTAPVEACDAALGRHCLLGPKLCSV
jgi:septum formation protein